MKQNELKSASKERWTLNHLVNGRQSIDEKVWKRLVVPNGIAT